MTDKPFTPEEEAELYQELGVMNTKTKADLAKDIFDKNPDIDVAAAVGNVAERPNPASAIVVQVPDVKEVEFDDTLIAHLDLTDGQQRAEASRILFANYKAAAFGLPKGTHASNWNSLIHGRISMHLGRKVQAKRVDDTDTLQRKVRESSAERVADTAALSTQAALKVLKDQILGEDGDIDLAKFAKLLQEA